MRTTLDLDDALMHALLDRFPGATKTRAVERAIEGYLSTGLADELRALVGTIEIEDMSAKLRAIDRHS